MSMRTELSDLRLMRLTIGTEILKKMDQEDEMPVKNIYRLTNKMMEYFYSMGYEDYLEEQGSRWLPDSEYWRSNIKMLRELLRGEQYYLEFVRDEGVKGFSGKWLFCKKDEFVSKLKQDHNDISVRTESFNEKVDDGQSRWKLQIKGVPTVPALV